MKITGTFIDEITFDIPPQNWGKQEWLNEFDIFHQIGIDTVIIIRSGRKQRGVFPSRVIGNSHDSDLARLFLDAAAQYNIKLFFGIYDSWRLYSCNWKLWKEEVTVNRKFIDEILDRYQGHPAFHGWYISHETSVFMPEARSFYLEIGSYMKERTPDMPVLISPYYPSGVVDGEKHMIKSPEAFAEDWRKMFQENEAIDICAFQDGTSTLEALPAYLKEVKEVTSEFGVKFWNNIETFSRDFPIKFPPIDYRILFEKLRICAPFVEKQITFEFSHFMSPQSMWPSARNLFNRYCEEILQTQIVE